MAVRGRWMALAGAAGLALGVLAGLALRSGDDGGVEALPISSGDRTLAREVDRLREELAAQRTLTSALQAEMGRLHERVEGVSAGAGVPLAGSRAAAEQRDDDERTERADRGAWFDPARLSNLDMDPEEIEELRRAFDAHQLEVLFLRDRATREGWAHQGRLGAEMQALRSEVREDLGDEGYDAMLWATGRPNRVKLASLLEGSPAVDAGLEDGDVVLRYDDRSIFDPRALQRATRSGDAGSTVAVDVLRGDEELRVYVPRGPLGAQLSMTRTPPRLE